MPIHIAGMEDDGMAEVNRHGCDVAPMGIRKATSECVLPDTPNDGRSPQTWISIDGLRMLGALVRQLQSEGARPDGGASREAVQPMRGRVARRRQCRSGADGGAGAAGGEGADDMISPAGEGR